MIRVLLAEDQSMVLGALAALLELEPDIEVVARARDGGEALRLAEETSPDVVLTDIEMPGMGGLDLAAELRRRANPARVVIVTTFARSGFLQRALAVGATGYLLKDSPPEELRRGVRAAARGEAVLSPSVATRLVGQVREPAREPLSQRELDILGLIARGCSNREAAQRLFISEATVKTHVLHVFAKLGVNDRAAAVAAGFERGLLPRP